MEELSKIQMSEKKEEDYSVMLGVTTFILFNVAFVAMINNDPLATWFYIIGTILLLYTLYYIYQKRIKSESKKEVNLSDGE